MTNGTSINFLICLPISPFYHSEELYVAMGLKEGYASRNCQKGQLELISSLNWETST